MLLVFRPLDDVEMLSPRSGARSRKIRPRDAPAVCQADRGLRSQPDAQFRAGEGIDMGVVPFHEEMVRLP